MPETLISLVRGGGALLAYLAPIVGPFLGVAVLKRLFPRRRVRLDILRWI